MNAEEQLVKQLEGLVSSMIKALESLEKEFSDYIDVTNRRLLALENKVQRFDTLKDIETHETTVDDKVSLESESIEEPETEPLVVKQTPAAEQPTSYSLSSNQDNTPIQPPITSDNSLSSDMEPEKTIAKPSLSTTHETSIPPVPQPPEVKHDAEKITSEKSPSISEQTPKEQTRKMDDADIIVEDEDDKKELMSALELIDSL